MHWQTALKPIRDAGPRGIASSDLAQELGTTIRSPEFVQSIAQLQDLGRIKKSVGRAKNRATAIILTIVLEHEVKETTKRDQVGRAEEGDTVGNKPDIPDYLKD